MDIAITRDVSRAIERCELTHIARTPIDYPRAVAQHQDYCRILETLGLEVIRLAADETCPDCCFVEDTAVVLDEVAVITPLGSPARRGETPAIEAALRPYRPLEHIVLPDTLEGGDVLVLGRRVFVGRTGRSNSGGIAALGRILDRHGYSVIPVAVSGCLHLKSAVTALDDETVLATPHWLDVSAFEGCRVVATAPGEDGAANVLRVRGQVLAHPGYPRTFERLVEAGYRITPVEIGEFVKAEGALTCKSLLLRRV